MNWTWGCEFSFKIHEIDYLRIWICVVTSSLFFIWFIKMVIYRNREWKCLGVLAAIFQSKPYDGFSSILCYASCLDRSSGRIVALVVCWYEILRFKNLKMWRFKWSKSPGVDLSNVKLLLSRNVKILNCQNLKISNSLLSLSDC